MRRGACRKQQVVSNRMGGRALRLSIDYTDLLTNLLAGVKALTGREALWSLRYN